MATRHVLCVHGIGKHANNWIETVDDGDISFKDLFFDRWNNLNNSHNYLPRHDIQLHSIHYDDAIIRLLNNWEEQLTSLSSGLADIPDFKDHKAFFDDVIEKSKLANDEKQTYIQTHLLDLLMFAGLYSVQDSIIVKVGNQIGDIIQNHVDKKGGDKVVVIGHSMGTAVAEKALKALFNETVTVDGLRYKLKGNDKLLAVMLIANVSYTLARDRSSFYQSIFRPGTGETQIMNHLLNINHKLDVVGQFLPFDPYRYNPDWITAKHRKRYQDVQISRLSSKNVHSINHYFRDPKVYLPVFEILGGRPISTSVTDFLLLDFEAQTPMGTFKSFQTSLDNLDVTNIASMREFYDKAVKMHQRIKEFRQ